MGKIKPTSEQKKIFHYIDKRKENLLIEARAGAGKTSTIVAAVNLIPTDASTTFLAFNKHIQEELKHKLPSHIWCYTSHGLGLSALKRKYGDDIQFDEFKADHHINKKRKRWKLGDEFKNPFEEEVYLAALKKLVNLCRATLTTDKKYVPYIADKYDVRYSEPKDVKRVLSVLEAMTNDRKTFDFTDMIYLPAIDNKIWMFPQDYVIVDECFPYNQYVSTEIGKKKIGHLAKMYENGEKLPMVTTFNEGGKFFVNKNIIKVWCNGERDIYEVVVGGKRKIKSTKNHKYLTLNGWKRLDELKIGDAIISNYNDQPYHGVLNEPQEDIFVGSILGDGSSHNLSKNISRIRVIHGKEQREYLEWKASFFNSNVELVENNGFASKIAYRFTSKGYYFEDKYKNTKNVIDNLTLKSLAIAWMDDGSISTKYNSSRLYSCAESKKLSEYLSNKIEKKWKIKSAVRHGKSSSTGKEYYWLYFNKENTIKLSNVISQFIHPSMEYKLCPKHRNNINIKTWGFNENQYGCMIVSKEYEFVKRDKVYDMEVEDNHNFIITSSSYSKNLKAKDYGLVAHNCQDLNRAQQAIIQKILKRDRKSGIQTGRLISVGDPFQCQPKGTKVLMYDGTEKNIEDIVVGDRVVSYDKKHKGAFLGFYKNHRWGAESMKNHAPVVEELSNYLHTDSIFVVESKGKKTKYTANHRCFVRFRPNKTKGHALYLMEKDGYFRIGITPLWSYNKQNSVTMRAKAEKADRFWILDMFENKHDAYIEEQYNSLMFGIPQLRFVDNKTGLFNQEKIDNFFCRFDKIFMMSAALKLLNKFNRIYNNPFWEKGEKHYFSKTHLFEIKPSNIIGDYMQMIHFDEDNVHIRTHGNGRTDKQLKVQYYDIDKYYTERHNDYVYSLKISKYENYVADGMLTHNSIYSFAGSDIKSFEWFQKQKNTKILTLTHSFRCGVNIVKRAQKIVPDIKARENAHDGMVRDGSILEEARDGDFVLCRTTMPLVKLFFAFMLDSKKAIIKGSDIGISLVEMTKEHKSVTESLGFWNGELKDFEKLLGSKGILNFEDHSGYVALKDKVGVLDFFGKISKNLGDMRKKIRQVFRDDIEGIVLSTVHKAKGLEADRVFIARPDKLPLNASTKWQADQEINLEYVAITRAKNELIYDWEWTDDEEDLDEQKEKLKKRRK